MKGVLHYHCRRCGSVVNVPTANWPAPLHDLALMHMTHEHCLFGGKGLCDLIGGDPDPIPAKVAG